MVWRFVESGLQQFAKHPRLRATLIVDAQKAGTCKDDESCLFPLFPKLYRLGDENVPSFWLLLQSHGPNPEAYPELSTLSAKSLPCSRSFCPTTDLNA